MAAKTDETVTDGHPVIGHPRANPETLTRVKNQKCLGYVESEEQIGVTTVPVARTWRGFAETPRAKSLIIAESCEPGLKGQRNEKKKSASAQKFSRENKKRKIEEERRSVVCCTTRKIGTLFVPVFRLGRQNSELAILGDFPLSPFSCQSGRYAYAILRLLCVAPTNISRICHSQLPLSRCRIVNGDNFNRDHSSPGTRVLVRLASENSRKTEGEKTEERIRSSGGVLPEYIPGAVDRFLDRLPFTK
ncbi:hypothetical protein K0M31_000778 [Melipona bicolor]|uniref:Uncharacterized protein n=1 Tax=Melipona bicolor TaxID=60889 RepID=A0AA40GE59_9HYME|nr:hypothetical protein K0M31_000778 [Melipona bicolor]